MLNQNNLVPAHQGLRLFVFQNFAGLHVLPSVSKGWGNTVHFQGLTVECFILHQSHTCRHIQTHVLRVQHINEITSPFKCLATVLAFTFVVCQIFLQGKCAIIILAIHEQKANHGRFLMIAFICWLFFIFQVRWEIKNDNGSILTILYSISWNVILIRHIGCPFSRCNIGCFLINLSQNLYLNTWNWLHMSKIKDMQYVDMDSLN